MDFLSKIIWQIKFINTLNLFVFLALLKTFKEIKQIVYELYGLTEE